jgi:hypothetical protein
MNAWLVVALVPLMAAVISCEHGKPQARQQTESTFAPASDGTRLDGIRSDAIINVASAATLPVSGEARAEAESIFSDRCAVCHGDNGEGNGPGADNLNPRPVNFHNQKWQRSISDERIAKAIVYGGQAVGLSASMAPNPDLESKPRTVAALVERIRTLGK